MISTVELGISHLSSALHRFRLQFGGSRLSASAFVELQNNIVCGSFAPVFLAVFRVVEHVAKYFVHLIEERAPGIFRLRKWCLQRNDRSDVPVRVLP